VIEARLCRAERQVRVQRGLLLAVFAGAVALVAVKPGITDGTGTTVKAPFRVVDETGNPLFCVAMVADAPGLALFKKDGSPGIHLGAFKEGGAIIVMDDAGKQACVLAASGKEASLDLRSGSDHSTVRLKSTEKGGIFWIADGSGRLGIGCSTDEDGGDLCVYGKAGKAVSRLKSREDGGSLEIYNHGGRLRGTMGVGEHGGLSGTWDNEGNLSVR
jgi:hypothetical protein